MNKIFFKLGLTAFLFFFCCSLINAEEQMTQGEFIMKFVKSLGLEYRLKEGANVEDYFNLLKEEGFVLPIDFNPNKVITKDEKADLLSQIISRGAEKEAGHVSKAEIYRNKALVEKIQGEVFVKLKEGEEWIPAKVDMELTEGSWVKTGEGAVLYLRVGIAGRIIIKEKSEMNLRELTTKADKESESILMYLAMGEIVVDVRFIGKNTKFETHTPTTVAAVRGTIYTVKVSPEEKTEVR